MATSIDRASVTVVSGEVGSAVDDATELEVVSEVGGPDEGVAVDSPQAASTSRVVIITLLIGNSTVRVLPETLQPIY
jgi:hypothetical protein